MGRTVRRASIFAVTLLMSLVGVVTFTGSAASAAPRINEVTQTAFIWNCPTGGPGCANVQTRVGDVRPAEPIADICQGAFSGREKNLIYNMTGRRGAAERTGFLYRENLQSPGAQTESCVSGGTFNNAPVGVIQRLCPYLTCGETGRITSNQITLREFCDIRIDGVSWHLTVAVNPATGGPLTAGFIHADDLNNPSFLQNDCTQPN